ncbi:hypothetical protein [Lacticaseibacillus pantheris]|jgi:hypothetical protein
MAQTIIYYKKDGDNIPVLSDVGDMSPFMPANLFDKIVEDFEPVLPLYLFVEGTSFRVKRISDNRTSS